MKYKITKKISVGGAFIRDLRVRLQLKKQNEKRKKQTSKESDLLTLTG